MVAIPDSHKDLLERPVLAALGTVQPDGGPQVTPVWIALKGDKLLVNTAAGRQKYKNLLERNQATCMLVDPDNTQRYIELRGTVAEVIRDANDDINDLSLKYIGTKYPWFVEGQERVTFLIEPTYVFTQ